MSFHEFPQSPTEYFTLVILMNIYDVHLIVCVFFFSVHLRLENSAEMLIILLN